MHVVIGPVPAPSALVWIRNSRRILHAVDRHTDELPFTTPPDVLQAFHDLLQEWEDLASRQDPFRWEGDEPAETVRELVRYWLDIDNLPDGDLVRIGVAWSPPEGRAMYDAVVHGVLNALGREPA